MTRRSFRVNSNLGDAIETAFARATRAVAQGDAREAETWAKAARALEDAERRCGLHRREQTRLDAEKSAFRAEREKVRAAHAKRAEELYFEERRLARLALTLKRP